MAVSPTKDNSSFFDGELTDGHAVIRIVGFDKAQHSMLREFQTKGLPFTLANCVIQSNKLSKKLEIVLKGYTQLNCPLLNLICLKYQQLGVIPYS